jgi:hypothetical protein
VTIKRPPTAVDGIPPDSFQVGKVFDVSPHVAIMLVAARWARIETRNRARRAGESAGLAFDRRELPERRQH